MDPETPKDIIQPTPEIESKTNFREFLGNVAVKGLVMAPVYTILEVTNTAENFGLPHFMTLPLAATIATATTSKRRHQEH